MANTSKKSPTSKAKHTKRTPSTKTATPKSEAHVTRIKASESSAPRVSVDVPAAKKAKKTDQKPAKSATNDGLTRRSPARAVAQYFAGAWYELRQVRWPNRTQTWQMTGAHIELQSRLNHGSTFSFTLPADPHTDTRIDTPAATLKVPLKNNT